MTSTPLYSASVSFGTSNLVNPSGLRYTNGDLWVVDSDANNLSEWTTLGALVTQFSTFDGVSVFNQPWGVGIDPDGYVYVADGTNSQVEQFSPAGSFVTLFGTTELGGNYAEGVAVNASSAYLLDYDGSVIIAYTVGGTVGNRTFTSPVTLDTSASGVFTNPYNLCLDSSGDVYVADHDNHRVVEFNGTGTYQRSITGADLSTPTDMTVDGSGNIYVTDNTSNTIVKFDSSGSESAVFGQGLNGPYGIDMDPSGNLYVADSGNSQIVVFIHN